VDLRSQSPDDRKHERPPDSDGALTRDTCHHVAHIIEAGHHVVVTHGNGPQVGFILRRSELTRQELHEVPLDSADADTQGAIGYMIQQSLANEFRRLP
jgi:carbamate kinase